MTDQAVIPAAPVVPAAPVASVVPTPAAQLAAVAPDPTPAVPAAPAAPASLVPDPAAAPAVPAAAPTSLVPDPAPAVTDTKWYLAKDVPGQGEAPDWFKTDKYTSVDEQAKAYLELEKRFGAFTGAPKDGVYKINVPADVPVEFDPSHTLFQELNKWAGESQLSQEAYDSVISMFARYEASVSPDMDAMKKDLGDNADSRLSSVAQWAKSNLSEDLYKMFRNAQSQSNASDTFKVFEAIINKTRQVTMPKPGDDVPGTVLTGLEEIKAMQLELIKDGDDKGKRRYVVDSAFRAKVENLRIQYFKAQSPKQ